VDEPDSADYSLDYPSYPSNELLVVLRARTEKRRRGERLIIASFDNGIPQHWPLTFMNS
jgi:hypothetical protein